MARTLLKLRLIFGIHHPRTWRTTRGVLLLFRNEKKIGSAAGGAFSGTFMVLVVGYVIYGLPPDWR